MEKAFKSILSVILGNFIYALTVTLFLMPSELVTGGTTGIALTVGASPSPGLCWCSMWSCF